MADAQVPLFDRVKKVALKLQFVWFLGHLITVIQTFFAFLSFSNWTYYKAFYGTLVSYGIFLYGTYGKPQFNKEFLARVLQDENCQYFILAVIWVTAAPIRVALIPYATFSLIHVLGYIRSDFLPQVFPGNTLPVTKNIAAAINTVLVTYQAQAIWLVARAEVLVIFPATIITIFWGTSIFTPFLYGQFLQFRFLSSPITRQVFGDLEVVLDKHVANNPQVPEWGKVGYAKTKDMIKQYCNLEARARAAQAAQQ
ncbi:hypothetical protein HK103_002625 [Boothiomyces macroporosus]|uniref:Pore membrane protein of 33 kDa n=1 Tax=Boothiomyces macroporosus TaxID=261099 RepID=A0AAD5YB65_9FUNG|nr:hypothetical protein HK103_002625 [Boothiomyces macroporosus]KAJ3315879.1 hypothetical protein HDV04_000086 [Boothiomyces sp. JEL0838]